MTWQSYNVYNVQMLHENVQCIIDCDTNSHTSLTQMSLVTYGCLNACNSLNVKEHLLWKQVV